MAGTSLKTWLRWVGKDLRDPLLVPPSVTGAPTRPLLALVCLSLLLQGGLLALKALNLLLEGLHRHAARRAA
jgi:hypothetical protein